MSTFTRSARDFESTVGHFETLHATPPVGGNQNFCVFSFGRETVVSGVGVQIEFPIKPFNHVIDIEIYISIAVSIFLYRFKKSKLDLVNLTLS
jgi:hypothetical protein